MSFNNLSVLPRFLLKKIRQSLPLNSLPSLSKCLKIRLQNTKCIVNATTFLSFEHMSLQTVSQCSYPSCNKSNQLMIVERQVFVLYHKRQHLIHGSVQNTFCVPVCEPKFSDNKPKPLSARWL